MPLRLDRMNTTAPITNEKGGPANWLQLLWQRTVEAIESAVTTLEATVATLDQAVDDIVAILVRLGLVEVTADGALELAESAINPDGTIKDEKVLTSSVAASAITRTTTFFHDFAGWAVAPGSFVDVSNGGFTAQVSVETTAFAEQGVSIDLLMALNRAGGADDNVTVRCIRTSDSTVMDQQYDFDVQGQNFTYAAKFYDSDPADSITDTYKIQINSDDATLVREVFLSGFLTLR